MTVNLATLQDVLNREFQEPLSDLVPRSNPSLDAIEKRAVASDAIYLKNAMSSDHEGEAVLDGSVVTPVNPKTNFESAVLPWTTYLTKFRVNKRVMAQVASNPGMVGSIFKTEVMNAGKDLGDLIAADMMGGVAANGLVGMRAIVDDANTYAGIDRTLAANANWRSAVVDLDNAGAASEISTGALYNVERKYFDLNSYGWDTNPGRFTGVTSSGVSAKYKALMENIDLASLSTAHFVNQANQSGTLGIGKTGFMGVPFIRDRNVDATGDLANSSRLYFLDMSMIHMCVLDPTAGDANLHQVQGYTTAPGTSKIKTQIEILGNEGEFVAGYVKAYIQLATPNPKAAGAVVKNILVDPA